MAMFTSWVDADPMIDPYLGTVTRKLRPMIAIALVFAVSLSVLNIRDSEGPRQTIDEPDVPLVKDIAQYYRSNRVLAIVAHPDDEQFAISLLYHAARAGSRVTLVTATRGENGRIAAKMRGKVHRNNLGSIRTEEVEAVGRLIGLAHQEVWDFPDDGLVEVPRTQLNGAVRDALCRYEPDLLVTFEPDSGYTGHRDHRRIGLIAVQMAVALAETPCGNGYSGPAEIAYPLTPTKAYTRNASARGRLAASRQPQANLAIPAPAWLRIDGWRIHRAQDNPLVHSFGLSEQELYARWSKEFYRVFTPTDPDAAKAPASSAEVQRKK